MLNTFLLIDDDDIFSQLLQRSFSRQNLCLNIAKNSEEALSFDQIPEGIILDLNLNGESGLQLLPKLKKKYPKSKILVLTGYASISTAVSAIKLGADQYLPKPAEIATILKIFNSDEKLTEDIDINHIPEQGPSLQRLQWEHIQFTLQQHKGNVSATARALNMHRRTLQRMLAKHPVKK